MKITPGEYRPAYAAEVYAALGPITASDIYRVKWMGETARRRYFHNIYGWQAAHLAKEDYRRMTDR